MNPSPITLPVPELGRIDVRQAARITGFAETDMPVLIRGRLLRPLGNPGPTAPRFFSAVEVRELAASRDWLDKAQRAVSQHNQRRNQHRVRRGDRPPSAFKNSLPQNSGLKARLTLSPTHC